MMIRFFVLYFLSICFLLGMPIFSEAAGVNYTYDQLDRLIRVEATDGTMLITYTYDALGNRLSMTSQGTGLSTPEVSDSGLFSLDNTLLDIGVTTYGEEYGNLAYEYAIGTSAGATDVVGWTAIEVGPDGTAIIESLNLPYNQEYFVSVRIKNFAGEVVSDIGSSDGIIVSDPVADPDDDGADNQSEILAGSDPLNSNSYPELTTINLRPGFNLIAIPAEVLYWSDLKDWVPILGNSLEIEEVMVYDHDASEFITLLPEGGSSGSFILHGAEGLIVYAKVDKEITFTSVLCVPHDLKQGFNLVGISCPQDGYTAFQLLDDLDSENVSSIQRFSAEDGAFETAAFRQDGGLGGIDFPIIPGEGYFIFMRKEVLGFGN